MENPEKMSCEEHLRARIRAGSQEPADYLNLAGLLRSASRFQDAAAFYEQGLQLHLSNLDRVRFVLELGTLSGDTMGHRAKAVTLAQEALRHLGDEPDSPEALLLRGLGNSLLAENVWTEDERAGVFAARQTVEILGRVIANHPDLKDITAAYTAAAWAHAALGQYEDSVRLCHEVLQNERDERYHLRALMTLAEALRCLGRFPEAVDAVNRALKHADRDPAAQRALYVMLGLIERGANHPIDAERAFQRALAILLEDPFSSTDRYHRRIIFGNLAEIFCEARNVGAAIGVLGSLLAEYPDDDWARHRVLSWLGDCHAAQGSYPEARRCYEQILASPVVSREDRSDAHKGLASLPAPTN